MEFKDLSLKEIITSIKSGKVSPGEVQSYFLDRIKKIDPETQAFNSIQEAFPTVSMDTAFAGAPIAVKDLFSENGIETTASSKMLAGFKPPYDSTVIARLKKAGMTSLGKVTLDEFAMGGSGENSGSKIARNPWALDRIPGGSSSGSAAAVAAGLAPAALGTDTGGSIRQPASMCGIVGFKPSYGRISRYGIIAMASSLDTPGFLTKTVEDSAFLYEITAGRDDLDSTSLHDEVKMNPAIWTKNDLKGKKIGVPKEYFIDGLDAGVKREIDEAIQKLESLGAEIVPISLPHTEYGLSVYYIVMAAEASTNLSRYDGLRYGHKSGDAANVAKNRSEGFGPEAQRRIMLGSFVLSSGFYDAYYKKASLVRELIRKDFADAFQTVDTIVTPVSPSVAWKIGEKMEDPLKMYLADIFTI